MTDTTQATLKRKPFEETEESIKYPKSEEEEKTDSVDRRLSGGTDSSLSANLECSAISIEQFLVDIDGSKKEQYDQFIRNAPEDDPPLTVNWKRVDRFFNAKLALGGNMPFPPPHTVEGFKRYLMERGRTAESAVPIDDVAFPCSVA